MPLPVAGSSPFPRDDVRDHEEAFSVEMKMLTVVPWFMLAGAERLPDAEGLIDTDTDDVADDPPQALLAEAWNVVACATGTTALPIAGRFAPTPSTVTTAMERIGSSDLRSLVV
ncbi:MAG TPA: hypothetical protein VF381_06915 [Thermoanaerobaculia bacterium]